MEAERLDVPRNLIEFPPNRSPARRVPEGSRKKGAAMARRTSLTDLLYRMARASATGRAASRGPAALAKRQVRRRVYRAEGKATRRIFKSFGL